MHSSSPPEKRDGQRVRRASLPFADCQTYLVSQNSFCLRSGEDQEVHVAGIVCPFRTERSRRERPLEAEPGRLQGKMLSDILRRTCFRGAQGAML